MMKSIRDRFLKPFVLVVLLFSILFAMMPAQVTHATQGSTGISFSSSSVKVGDTVKVTVTGSGIDQIRVTYTARYLTLTGCTASGYSASGSTVSFMGNRAVLTFSAKAAGSAEFVVRANVLSGCSAIMKVSDPAAETQTTDQAQTQDQTAQTQDQTAQTDQTAQSDQTSQNAADSSGDATVLKVGDVSYKLSTPESLPTDLLQETQVTIDNTSYPAYILKDANDGFYYFYASADDADPDWYQYDSNAKTMTRANDEAFGLLDKKNTAKDSSDSASADKSSSNNKKGLKASIASLKDKIVNADSNTKLRVLLVIGAVLVILLVLSIINMIRHRKDDREADPFDEDFYPDEDEDDIDNDDEKNIEDDDEIDEDDETEEDGEIDTDNVNDADSEVNSGIIEDSEPSSSDSADADGLNSSAGIADTDGFNSVNEPADDTDQQILAGFTDTPEEDSGEHAEDTPAEADSPAPDSTYRTISGMELNDHLDDDLEDQAADEAAEAAEESADVSVPDESTASAEEASSDDSSAESTNSEDTNSESAASEDTNLEAEEDEEDEEEEEDAEEDHPTKKKKSFFHRRKDQDIWEDDDDETSKDPIKPVNHEKMIENAKKRKKKLGNDDDFMDLNDF
jgi:hypothetical protein